MFRSKHFLVICSILLMASSMAWAAKPAMVPKAPIPAQILAARSIFIANGGASVITFDDSDLTYDEFYAGMKTWGRYQLATAPDRADLIYEISLQSGSGIIELPVSSTNLTDVRVVLTIVDPKTQTVLWRCSEHVKVAALAGTWRKNFDAAVEATVTDAMALVSPIPHAQ